MHFESKIWHRVRAFTDKNVDLKKRTWPALGESSDRSDLLGYGPVTFTFS